jgi:hypothetical protein
MGRGTVPAELVPAHRAARGGHAAAGGPAPPCSIRPGAASLPGRLRARRADGMEGPSPGWCQPLRIRANGALFSRQVRWTSRRVPGGPCPRDDRETSPGGGSPPAGAVPAARRGFRSAPGSLRSSAARTMGARSSPDRRRQRASRCHRRGAGVSRPPGGPTGRGTGAGTTASPSTRPPPTCRGLRPRSRSRSRRWFPPCLSASRTSEGRPAVFSSKQARILRRNR